METDIQMLHCDTPVLDAVRAFVGTGADVLAVLDEEPGDGVDQVRRRCRAACFTDCWARRAGSLGCCEQTTCFRT